MWEALYFDHDLAQLQELADLARSVGVERYVLDDGWFRGRRDEDAGRGDWWVDEQVWPNGLGPRADYVRSLGMQLGLWFEPEMVNPDSELYPTERGETPGAWIGSGLAGIDGLNAGDAVTAEQMRALFGAGMHPLAATRLEQLEAADLTDTNIKRATQLGAPFKVYAGDPSRFRVEVAQRIATRQAAVGQLADESVLAALRAQVRTEVAREFFRAEHGRDPIDAREIAAIIAKLSRPRSQTVASYDLTFSPVKSVSTLWAVANSQVAAQIERAHQAAVQDALSFIERHALFTRQGRNGCGRSM